MKRKVVCFFCFVFQNENKMAATLRIILGEDNASKLSLPNGIPSSLEYLKEEIRRQFGLTGNFRLQYRDIEFDNEFELDTAFRNQRQVHS